MCKNNNMMNDAGFPVSQFLSEDVENALYRYGAMMRPTSTSTNYYYQPSVARYLADIFGQDIGQLQAADSAKRRRCVLCFRINLGITADSSATARRRAPIAQHSRSR